MNNVMNNAEEALGDFVDDFTDDVDANAEPEEEESGEDEGDDDAEDDASEVEGDEEEGEGEEAAEKPEPVKPPVSWSKEDAEIFAKLDPAAQAVIQRREAERDRFVQQKSVEAAQTRDKVANEARDIIVRQHEEFAQKLEVYARSITPQRPDQRLLYTGNQDDIVTYHRQQAAYEGATAQLQELQQQIAQSQQAANAAREQSQHAERQMDAQRLREALPEWFDPASTIQTELQSIGQELGYPEELMREASSTDILALKKALEWKSKADKFDQAMGKKMETVRAAKGLPKMAKPGAKPSKQHMSAVGKEKAWARVKASGGQDGSAMADFLGL
ncbi:hypothetical protein [Sphingobium abikonense]|uniref:hypothetical protein n=1 Tax=Sphingobium abikonense TaxID=86193 RepID=UPI0035141692